MINLTVYGLDEFVVGAISKDLTKNIAKIYEVSEDDVNFIATNAMVFHSGVEQTSWHVIIHVHAPMKVKVLQDQALKVIVNGFKGPCIHIEVEFYYYSEMDRKFTVNEEYPRYITDDNSVDVEQSYSEELEEGEEDDQIYTGDIFSRIKR